MQKVFCRRDFIAKHLFLRSVILGATAVVAGCESNENSQKKEKNSQSTDPCKDLSQVSKNDIEARVKLGYVEKSPVPDKECGNCNLHIPPAAGSECGGCMLFKGPVYSSGYCTYWAPQIQSA